jgi:hypothetical protein
VGVIEELVRTLDGRVGWVGETEYELDMRRAARPSNGFNRARVVGGDSALRDPMEDR